MTEQLKPCPLCKGEAELDTMRHVNARPDQGLLSEPAIYCLDCYLEITDSYGEGDLDDEQIIQMLIDKWNTRPAPAVKVKPLEWRNSYGVERADTEMGTWFIQGAIVEFRSANFSMAPPGDKKEAAQAKQNERILSAIQIRPNPDTAALGEALREIAGGPPLGRSLASWVDKSMLRARAALAAHEIGTPPEGVPEPKVTAQ